MKLEKYVDSSKAVWDDFIKKSKNGLFFFNTNYLFYHADRFKDHSLLIRNDSDELLAVFPANENNTIIYSHQGLTFGSLIVSYKTKAIEVLEIFNQIISYYQNLGFKKIIYKQIPYHFSNYPSQEDLYALFRNNAILIRRDISSVIKIENKINFSPTKKNLVNKCSKLGISVKEADTFEAYWPLLEEVLSKFNAKPIHNIEEISALKRNFNNEIRLFEAWKDDQLLAGVVIFDFGNVVHTQYMANSNEGRKNGVLDYINYCLIDTVYKDKKYFSFGISNEEDGRKLNEGLIQQKELQGGRGICLDFYEINL